MQIIVPENVKLIINKLNNSGFKAYMVGGCVRDTLLGIKPDDFDICTNAKPKDIIALFDKTVTTGIKYGTVTVILSSEPVEVTTFRTDSGYNDLRRPENVTFTDDLKTDLSRRDFTVNAMCFDEKEEIIDFFGGMDDLTKKTLRTVGDAELRFGEDALRILRLFRFCSTLAFTAEKKTLKAAIENAKLLKAVSAERIREELFRTASGDNISAVLPLLEAGGIEVLRANEEIVKIPRITENKRLKFFAFLKLTGKSLSSALDFLKCSNDFKSYCLKLDYALTLGTDTKSELKRLLKLLEADVFDLLEYKSAILGEDICSAQADIKRIIGNNEPYKISQLAVNGNDIANKGYRGEQIGDVLESILEKVTENPKLNTKEKIMELI